MAHRTAARRARQVGRARQQLAQAPDLPFADLLPAPNIQPALDAEAVTFRDRLFSPFLTLWIFLSQVLDPDPSCRQAVARFLAYRSAQGLPPCSADPGAYCKARGRLPQGVLARLTRDVGRDELRRAPVGWRWQGRVVKVVDGTTASMPDTPENQAAYPQPRSQQPGVGFPLLRLVVVFSLAVGTALDAAFGPYRGKETGEPALFRGLHEALEAGDVVLADRCFCSYWEVALLRRRGVDVVFRLHQRRKADFRRGCRRSRHDHVAFWPKPARPDWMTPEEYAALPGCLLVREVRVRVRQRGFRTREYVVATSLRDAAIGPEDLAELYRARWQAELHLRSLKAVMQLDVLRGQTPEMVGKEIWAHLLAYNLIRGVVARAAREAGAEPWEISFKGALQTVNAYLPYLLTASAERRRELVDEMLRAMGRHRVGNRPDRNEPRARKRRPKHYPQMNVPREQARKRTEKGTCG